MKKVILLVSVALIAISCGNDKKIKQEAKPAVKQEVVEEPKKETSLKEVTILLSSSDQMQYGKNELKVEARYSDMRLVII
jgi:hypothetical protein